MGTWYYARLLWGIKVDKPNAQKNAEEQDRIDKIWEDDVVSWLELKGGGDESGVTIESIPYCYDGCPPDEAGYYLYPKEISFQTEMYSFMEVKSPQFDEAEMATKLKAACKKLGVKFSTPRWYLMTESH
jgi:hypothetical protein